MPRHRWRRSPGLEASLAERSCAAAAAVLLLAERSRTAVAALLLLASAPAAWAHASAHDGTPRFVPRLDAYAFPPSVAQGDSVRIFVSTDAPTFGLEVRRDDPTPAEALSVSGLAGHDQAKTLGAWENGCAWAPSYSLKVQSSWPSGVYICDVMVGSQVAGRALFTVRQRVPGSTSRILFQSSTATWQAYNNWGGKSLYDSNSSDSARAHAVSFRRPYAQGYGLGDYASLEQPFVHWLESEGIAVEFCTDLDLHANFGLLDAYDLLLIAGHDEYFSWEQRDHIEAFLAKGGNAGIFSGNTCWWQIRISEELDRITCYKSRDLDPMHDIDSTRVTIPWAGVRRPENLWTGVSFRHGGFVNAFGWYPASAGFGGYTAYHTEHWVFAGTGLADGEVFGRAATVVGAETDGARFSWVDGRPLVNGTNGTPASYRILGLSPASWGHATMGIYTHIGTVFNAATTGWTQALASDPVIATITRNVVRRLSTSTRDAGAVAYRATRLWVEPNPVRSRAQLLWRGNVGAPAFLTMYSCKGRLVVRMPVAPWPLGGSTTWDGLDARGRRAPNGVYVARLTGPHGSASSKLLLSH